LRRPEYPTVDMKGLISLFKDKMEECGLMIDPSFLRGVHGIVITENHDLLIEKLFEQDKPFQLKFKDSHNEVDKCMEDAICCNFLGVLTERQVEDFLNVVVG
jgi:hypothetical protein